MTEPEPTIGRWYEEYLASVGVTIDKTVAQYLVLGALDQLHLAEQDEGCCPGCCGPCMALDRLLRSDQLDDIVRSGALGSEWWDEANDQVDRAWLKRAWRMVSCHVG